MTDRMVEVRKSRKNNKINTSSSTKPETLDDMKPR